MHLSRRHLAPAIYAVIYGSIVALGQALHSLPGLEHSEQAASASCCCHYHCESEPKTSDSGGQETPDQHDDCPICHFLGLAKLKPASFLLTTQHEALYYEPVQVPADPGIAPVRLFSARGPPPAVGLLTS